MSHNYREINIGPFEALLGTKPLGDMGPAPVLDWLKIDKLIIDPTYQREIGRAGERNVISIARNFDWTKFGTVIVATVEGGRFAIVDGQHRTTAAKLRGIAMVPCQIISATAAKQAASFASINGQVTVMTPMQIHAAKVAAGDPKALALDAACADGGVTICRYPVPGNKMKVGETGAVSAIARLLNDCGHARLVLALRCITKTGDGNAGFVRKPIVKAICGVLGAEPSLAASESRLLTAMQDFNFEERLELAGAEARKAKKNVEVVFSTMIFKFLVERLRPETA